MDNVEQKPASSDTSIQRLGRNGYLHRITPIVDSTGKIVQRLIKPLMVEFRARDLMQTLVGASILAIPAAYTEETWDLGQELALTNIVGIAFLSLFFIGIFVYYNFYKSYFKQFVGQYFFRVLATYAVSFAVVALLLTLIDKCPWGVDNMLAIKRIIVVAFPASMSATVTDAIK
ncbi:DUF2391 family protein [Kangiella sp. TOML190]|uniref:DUF2391 family protein n=1 Tax=Kangiella sp. TOML190 TaxID=2931351 RepID=UPI00203B3432|nr:DUF2391 family protein [Kangiella sp. TOML190]